jgi:hypothetical protein
MLTLCATSWLHLNVKWKQSYKLFLRVANMLMLGSKLTQLVANIVICDSWCWDQKLTQHVAKTVICWQQAANTSATVETSL